MSEMVERVKAALQGFRPREYAPDGYWTEETWDRVARAAILAMREPTDAMLDDASPSGTMLDEIRVIWARMIDEALR